MYRILLCLALTGCGSMNSAVNAYGSYVVDETRASNDTMIKAWTVAACATPYSAIKRNPEIIPTIKTLCGDL